MEDCNDDYFVELVSLINNDYYDNDTCIKEIIEELNTLNKNDIENFIKFLIKTENIEILQEILRIIINENYADIEVDIEELITKNKNNVNGKNKKKIKSTKKNKR
jgi:hypothetical protein